MSQFKLTLKACFVLILAGCDSYRHKSQSIKISAHRNQVFFQHGLLVTIFSDSITVKYNKYRRAVEIYDIYDPQFCIECFFPMKRVTSERKGDSYKKQVEEAKGGWNQVRNSVGIPKNASEKWISYGQNTLYCFCVASPIAESQYGLLLSSPVISRSSGKALNYRAAVEMYDQLPLADASESRNEIRSNLIEVIKHLMVYQK